MDKKEESAEKLRSFIDFLNHSACILDEYGYIEKLNEVWQNVSEKAESALFNVNNHTNYLEHCKESQEEACQQFFEAILEIIQGRSDFFEMTFTDFISNEERKFLARAYPIHGIEDKNYIVEHIDITEAKSDHKRAKKLEAEYKTILDNTHDAMFFVNIEEDGTYIFIMNNRQHQKLTGLSQAQLTGKTPYELLDKETADFVVSNYEACVREKSAVDYEETLDLPAGQGTYHTVLSPVIENGKVTKIIGSGRDITAKKRVEELNEKFFEGLPYPAWLINKNRRIQSQNRAGKAMGSSSVGDTCWFSFHGTRTLPEEQCKYYEETGELPPDAKCSFCRADEALNTGQTIVDEVEMDGVVFENGWVPLDEELYLHYAIDVTRYREAEKKHRESEELFRNLVENAPDMIVRFNTDFEHVYCNDATEFYLGVPKEFFLGKTFKDLVRELDDEKIFPESKAKEMIGALNKALETSKEQEIEMSFDFSSEVKCFSTRIVPERNEKGEIESLLAITRDITNQKRTEEKLEETTELFNKVLEATKDGVWDWVITTGEAYFSDNYYTMLGFEPGEFEANFENWRALLHPDDLAAAEKEIKRCFAGRKEGFEIEFRLKTKDEGYRWIHGRGKVVERDDNGYPTRVVGTHIDINEKKEQEEMINSIIKGAETVSLIVTDLNSIVKEFSPGAEAIFGYSREEILGEHVGPLHTFSEVQKFPDYIEKLKENREGFTVETELVRKSGEKFPARFTLQPLFDNKGNLSGTLGISIDISDLKETERKLRESEEKFRSFVENANDIIFTVDDKASFTYVSPNWEEIVGYKVQETVNENIYKFIYSEDTHRVASAADKILQKGYLDGKIEYRVVTKNGNWRWHAAKLSVLEKREYETIVLGIGRDITEKKQAEKALRQSEERFRFLVENASEGILVVQDGLVKYVNNEITKFLGYGVEEMLETPFTEYIHPDDKDMVLDKYQKRMQGEKPEERYRFRAVRKDGEIRWVELSAALVEWGDHYATINLVIDITEQKEAEERIYHLSFHDTLTGLYNRAYLEEEIKRLDTERQLPISIIMADLNGLKLVNDTYGHDIGDHMLKKVAEILRNSCRSEDIVARWGGDEFVILLPQTSEEEVEVIENRIVNNCKGVYLQDLPVSLSLGSSVKKTPSKDIKQVLKEAEDNMYKHKLAESRSARSSVLYTLLKTLGEKSYETEAHTQRMMTIAWRIGEKIGLSYTELNRLQLLITLHDIGKINFPLEVLTKQGRLTSEEWEMMKEHPAIGYRIARATEEFAHVAGEILSHHERWDGEGYPRGLKGEEIPLLSRIVTIVDAYDVMSNGRPYKTPKSQTEIISELRRCSGEQFDPELVEVFISILEEK